MVSPLDLWRFCKRRAPFGRKGIYLLFKKNRQPKKSIFRPENLEFVRSCEINQKQVNSKYKPNFG